MAIEPVPHIDPAPVPGPQRGDESTFDDRMDAKIRWDETSAQQFGALGDNVAHNAAEALSSATAAAAQASTASGYAVNASNSASAAAVQVGLATTQAGIAATKAGDAAASATAAANSAISLTATSTTSLVMGNGTQVLTVPAGKQFPQAAPLALVSAGAPTNKMFGTVFSYSGTTLTMTITSTEGTGTFNDWVISPAGAHGPQGGTAGGQLTSALDEKKGTAPASSGTPDIWGAGGNYVPITSTTTVSGFPNAPQPGAKRTLKAEASFILTSGANLIVHGGTVLVQAADEIDIVADTVSQFRATVRRGDGTPTIPVVFRNSAFLTASQTFNAKVTGPHRITLVGACGSGAVATLAAISGSVAALASGGAGGGIPVKTANLTIGDAVVFAFGVGGSGVARTSNSNGGVAGNAGTVSTVTGPGFTLTANGGQGGKFVVGTSGTAAGAVGGTATGGDYNFKGGDSGSVSTNGAVGTNGFHAGASGGAVCSYSGSIFNSGNVALNGSGSGSYVYAATGGSAVGGKSGNATATDSNTPIATGGAGSQGASIDLAVVTYAPGGPGVPVGVTLTQIPLTLNGAGSDASFSVGTAAPTLAGAASGAVATSSASLASGNALLLGGTGGVVAVGNSATSGRVSYGAGTGAAVVINQGTSPTATSQNAGAPFAIIEWP